MLKIFLVALLGSLALAGSATAVLVSPWWWAAACPLLVLALVAVHDLVQRRHSVLRNYPLLGHLRFALEALRPELQQYFIERNFDGRPFDRDTRSIVYERAKGTDAEEPFGTELDLYRMGSEFLTPSMAPRSVRSEAPRVRIGGPECTQPYDMALLNVSAMSFGSLSANAVLALNTGAQLGGFAHDTGEGGLSEYHLRPGGDLVWEIGTGYFGCRTDDGDFDERQFAEKAAHEQVKCVSLKISQGAKPGIGGVLPGAKVNAEIAAVRGVPQGETVISPPFHRVYSTPRELVRFLARMRELADGKPVGFKLCVGSRHEFLAVCKAMLEEGSAPDFIIVDGAEGGTGAAPLEFADNVGLPLGEGLMAVHNALVGVGLRDRIRIGASGKVATGGDLVKRLLQGADYTNSARAMMFAIGCIQAQRCHTNACPVGVATQDERRARAIDIPDKSQRVRRYQQATVKSALQIIASMGVDDPRGLRPHMLLQRVNPHTVRSYAELHEWLAPGQLLASAPSSWAADWKSADPDRFTH
ncbi:FMN-binding glutamate synthase family protein [Streptomyces olivochromogenes]|uniref:FMN-binding glutamate synthase family protein n=1 Tax=Streptomyces olivochromogenes TaxID=1963 RepID=A0A250VV81_STROL|nr:FMN-binding glutamate synthase family protein [Streptomyces olivochromogenes]KUN35219.1 glutamate synthase [Streptomyces olivochromogenes]GAX58127.1 FMN-binding glutamate synthase family protein [Streptomyces olivochromogenes]